MKKNLPDFKKAVYLDIQRNWRTLGPFFKSETASKIWQPCMHEYHQWRCEEHGIESKARFTELPRDYDGCDWRFDTGRRGPNPAFWDYACHSACHWVADLALYVAIVAYPEVNWRIQTARHHSTVWNGDRKKPILFDINFLALGVPASQALQIACKGRELKPWTFLKGYLFKELWL